MKINTGVMIFGRMNPVHSGHLDLLNFALNISPHVHLYTSETHDSKNILSPIQKCNLIEIAFPDMMKYLKVVRNPFIALKELDKYYKNMIFVCGNDRNESFESVFERFNQIEYFYDSIEVRSLERNDLSSTELKKYLSTEDYDQVLEFYRIENKENPKGTEIVEFYKKLKKDGIEW